MKILALILFDLMLVTCVRSDEHDDQKVMVFLLDGFRWDYFDRPNLPNFKRLIDMGTKAEYMTCEFPTYSMPNYYSIMTGLHTESHGMVGNSMYNDRTDSYFLLSNFTTWLDPDWWNGGEPLWVTAEKQGKKAFMYYWPGCQVNILNTRPTFCEPYFYGGGNYPDVDYVAEAMYKGIQNFKSDSADFVGIYSENPDYVGHKYGPVATQLNQKLEELDAAFGQLLDNLTAEGLDDKVVIMVFSDHGMTIVSPDKTVNVTDYLDTDNLKSDLYSKGPITEVWPKDGKLDEAIDNSVTVSVLEKVYNSLVAAKNQFGHINVYKKNDIPDSWNFKNNDKTAPINIVADLGWYILNPSYKTYSTYGDGQKLTGHHGYLPREQDMRGVFVASGPGIKEKTTVTSIKAVDVYQLMCHVLDITPSAHNGTWSRVSNMLKDTSSSQPLRYMLSLITMSIYFAVVIAS